MLNILYKECHKIALMLSVVMLNVIMLSVAMVCVVTLLLSIIYEFLLKVRVFVPCKLLQHTLMFAGIL
jgi:hypothetical protein